MIFHFLAYNIHKFLFICGVCLKVVFEFEWGATYFSSLRAKLILATLGMPK